MEILMLKLDQGAELSREELLKFATQTDENLNRLSLLVSDMLDLSRINLGKLTIQPQWVNLSDVIEEGIERARLQMEFAGCVPEIESRPKSTLKLTRIESGRSLQPDFQRLPLCLWKAHSD